MLRHAIVLSLILLVAGCGRVGESRLNPFNWFGQDESQATTIAPEAVVDPDARVLVATVSELTVLRRPGGIIVSARSVPPAQGWFDAALVPTTLGSQPLDGVLSYTFEARPPETATRISTEASRELIVGRFISEFDLAGVREIHVIGAENTQVSRR